MLTKKLKFSEDVLTIIRTMEWSDDGKLGKLTCGQLERDMYVKVNKALEAMGGKWNRKAGGHTFLLDPRPNVAGLLDNGYLTIERDGFFQTPAAVVERMKELVTPRGRILEPEAGLGAIADNLGALLDITCIEKNEQRADALMKNGFRTLCMDFLEYSPDAGKFDTIFMNPPFEEGQEIDHIRHAYECLAGNGEMVSVMSEGPFFRGDRKATEFRQWLSSVKGKSESLPQFAFRESGTGIQRTRLVIIRK